MSSFAELVIHTSFQTSRTLQKYRTTKRSIEIYMHFPQEKPIILHSALIALDQIDKNISVAQITSIIFVPLKNPRHNCKLT